MITLKQVDGGEVSPKDDGLLYDFLIDQSGIFEGCTVTHNGANQLVVANGRGIVKGRIFEIVSETVLSTLSTSGTKQGRLLVKIDLFDLATPIKFVTQVADSLPELSQQDLNRGGTVYELPLATYVVSPTLISDLVDARTIITAVTVSPLERSDWNSKAAKNHTHTKSQITDFPSSLPANGGNADTVDGSHAWQMQTLNESGGTHGMSHQLICQWQADGADYFKLKTTEGLKVKVDNSNLWNGIGLWIGTQAQYDAISSKSGAVLYFIRG